MTTFLAIDAKDSCKKAIKDKQTSHINNNKHDNLIDKNFDYIHIARCCQLFSLT